MKTDTTTITAALLVTATFLTLAPTAEAQAPKPPAQAEYVAASLPKEDEQGIRKTVMGVEESWNAHDMKAFAKLLREDAHWVNVVGMHWRGRDAVVKAHAIFHEIMFQNCKLKTDSIEARPLGSDYAIAVVTTTQDAFTTPDGHESPKGQTRLSFVLARSPDGWKIVHAENVRVDAEAAKNDPVNSGPKPK